MVNAIHHVSLLTGDIPATTAFYRQKLGLRLVKNTVNQENVHMRHIFYGDYIGTPGTVITFFGIDRLGPRYDGHNFLSEIELAIPSGSGPYWRQRLGRLAILDPNDVAIRLRETPEVLPVNAQTTSDIPGPYQITHILSATLTINDVPATSLFFQRLLGTPLSSHEVALTGSYLKLVSTTASSPHRFGRGSMDHVAISVPDEQTLAQIETQAKAYHYNIEKRADRGWFKSLYIREPNDIRIEFATTSPGFTLDEPLAHLGEGLGLPPAFASQRAALLQYYHAKGVDFDD